MKTIKRDELNPRSGLLLLNRILFGLPLTNPIKNVVIAVCGILKPRSQMIRPLHFLWINFRPSKFFIKIALVAHVTFLGLGYKFGQIYDFTPILWYISSEIQGIDTSDCMNMPIEVWSRIPQCVEE